MANGYTTHDVFNQPPPLENYNGYELDRSLQQQLNDGAAWAKSRVSDYGALCGGSLLEAGYVANENPPVLHSHDRAGHRIDRVTFHPAYHQLMAAAIASGWPTLPWAEPQPGAQVARAAMAYLHQQVESGSGCPLTMTFASLPVVRKQSRLAALWEPLIVSKAYSGEDRPYFEKPGVTLGMGLTEKQGGTDVLANTSSATFRDDTPQGPAYSLVGHKWFFSAPMSDAFLVLAQAEAGLSCFLVPRWRPDGERNAIAIQRLKDKLGNCSNASSEVEFQNAFGWLIGDEGRGVATIIDMVALTRFDCMVGSTALMRQALVQALHHCQHRKVFGRQLTTQPLMQNVLADLVVEQEAALAMTFRLARALDRAADDEMERGLARIATAVGKFWICKRANGHISEAMECLGGGGYVEESILPRLYREAPVNSIWEGSGNVQCLDILRAIKREPDSLAALLTEIQLARGADARFDKHLERIEWLLTGSEGAEYRSRALAESLATGLQASLLLRGEQSALADLYCASRLTQDGGGVYGCLPASSECMAVLRYSWPLL